MKVTRTAPPKQRGVGRPTNERVIINLLDELCKLLRSPTCTHCGAKGAIHGNPNLCEICRNNSGS